MGAGPGAPDLLTLRAARLLEAADIVFHDALVHPDTLALAKRARLVDVGKRYGKVSTEQRFINRSLIEAAHTHALVVRLKGGDPMLFGRAQEEIDALERRGHRGRGRPRRHRRAGRGRVASALAHAPRPTRARGLPDRRGAAPTNRLRMARGRAAAADTVAMYMAAAQLAIAPRT